jgi:hypothetical protein
MARRGRTITFTCVNVSAALWTSRRYRIVVRGELDPRFAYLFNGMGMERHEGTTVLEGQVRDPAQLHGFIARIQELGLELLSVEQTGQPIGPTDMDGESGGQAKA